MTPPSNRPSITSSRLTGVTAAPHLPPFIIPLTTRELPAPPPGPRDVPTALTAHCDSPQLHDVTALFNSVCFCIHYIRPEGLFSSWDFNYVHQIFPCNTDWLKYTCLVITEESGLEGWNASGHNMQPGLLGFDVILLFREIWWHQKINM